MPTGSDYEDVRLGKSNSVTRQQENYGVSGDFGQVSNAPSAPEVSTENYPNQFGYGYDANNRQFSSDVSGDPKTLLREAGGDGLVKHADLTTAYGYNQPTATLGSHPWLRDELANPTEREPGNAEPIVGLKVPFKGGRY